jgi:hypothetical protein
VITRPTVSQPVTAAIGAGGQLIHADEPLRRLHEAAGGDEGGMLAIPALAALAALTRQIKMRLARPVKVADGDQDMELWVESVCDGDIVRLSVLGWNTDNKTSNTLATQAQRDRAFDAASGIFYVRLDDELRLISVEGAIPAVFDAASIGEDIRNIVDILDDDIGQDYVWFTDHRSFVAQSIRFSNESRLYTLAAEPDLSASGEFVGYSCTFTPVLENYALQTGEEPAILFGQQLAPALRQPLGRIIANAETIGSKLQGPIRENYAAYAKDIADAARHLVALVDDLGDLEAVERPDFSTAQDVIELGDVARRVAGLLALKAADHQITVATPDESEIIRATAEFRRVLQILLNLVTNAIRYSPDGTHIEISIADLGNLVAISVTDQGAGIDPENNEKIFQKFERLGRTGDGGSGLGLYISRRLARFMGGDLTVTTGEQGGATFTLTLPSG